jgi:hypothetical protein
MRTIIIGAVLLALTGQAAAENDLLWSANRIIMPWCRSVLAVKPGEWTTKYQEGRCVGVVYGLAGTASGTICGPGEATVHQMIAVVVQHIELHPQDMHRSFARLAYRALKEAWPCKPDQADK